MQSYFGSFPSPAQDHVEAPISLDDLLDIQAPHIYIVRASGNSMTAAGIYDGDWLIIDRSLTAHHGHIIIAALHGEPLVRLLHRPRNSTVDSVTTTPQLHADNPLYRPIHLKPDDDFYIWGVVRHSIRHHHSGGLHSVRTHTDSASAAPTATTDAQQELFHTPDPTYPEDTANDDF